MGTACGLFAGAETASASLGVTSNTIREMMFDADTKKEFLEMISACYAITYIFGTIGPA